MKVFGKMSRSNLARVVLPLDEQPERPTMIAFWPSMMGSVTWKNNPKHSVQGRESSFYHSDAYAYLETRRMK